MKNSLLSLILTTTFLPLATMANPVDPSQVIIEDIKTRTVEEREKEVRKGEVLRSIMGTMGMMMENGYRSKMPMPKPMISFGQMVIQNRLNERRRMERLMKTSYVTVTEEGNRANYSLVTFIQPEHLYAMDALLDETRDYLHDLSGNGMKVITHFDKLEMSGSEFKDLAIAEYEWFISRSAAVSEMVGKTTKAIALDTLETEKICSSQVIGNPEKEGKVSFNEHVLAKIDQLIQNEKLNKFGSKINGEWWVALDFNKIITEAIDTANKPDHRDSVFIDLGKFLSQSSNNLQELLNSESFEAKKQLLANQIRCEKYTKYNADQKLDKYNELKDLLENKYGKDMMIAFRSVYNQNPELLESDNADEVLSEMYNEFQKLAPARMAYKHIETLKPEDLIEPTEIPVGTENNLAQTARSGGVNLKDSTLYSGTRLTTPNGTQEYVYGSGKTKTFVPVKSEN